MPRSTLAPWPATSLKCAILKPAEKIQLEFEPGLVWRILNDVGDEPGNLPLLSLCLRSFGRSDAVAFCSTKPTTI